MPKTGNTAKTFPGGIFLVVTTPIKRKTNKQTKVSNSLALFLK